MSSDHQMADTADVPAIQVTDLAFTFANSQQPTLHGISFSIAPGTWTLMTGPTGAGKSTLLRAIAGLLPLSGEMAASQGKVLLFGADVQQMAVADRARQVGMLLQSPDDQRCATSLEGEIAFGLENLAMSPAEIGQRIAAALARFGLAEVVENRSDQLSGGQKQRLLLAALWAMRPRILLLDEPLAQLDPATAIELLDELETQRQQGLTIVIADHRLEDLLPRADQLLVLNQGMVTADLSRAESARWGDALLEAGVKLPDLSAIAHRLSLPINQVSELAEVILAQTTHAVVEDRQPVANDECPAERLVLVEVIELGFQYPGARQAVWSGVNFRLHAGERVALVGLNGSGKSTLLSVLAGLELPTQGTVVRNEGLSGLPRGLVLQDPSLMLFCRTVRQELAFGMERLGLDQGRIDEQTLVLAEQFSLQPLLDRAPLSLSVGQRLRVAVAATWACQSPLLLLDEPTTGQDRRQVDQLMSLLAGQFQGNRHGQGDKRASHCLVFSTHDLRVAANFADRVLVLSGGTLLADCSPVELLKSDNLLATDSLQRTHWSEITERMQQIAGVSVDEIVRQWRRGAGR